MRLASRMAVASENAAAGGGGDGMESGFESADAVSAGTGGGAVSLSAVAGECARGAGRTSAGRRGRTGRRVGGTGIAGACVRQQQDGNDARGFLRLRAALPQPQEGRQQVQAQRESERNAPPRLRGQGEDARAHARLTSPSPPP